MRISLFALVLAGCGGRDKDDGPGDSDGDGTGTGTGAATGTGGAGTGTGTGAVSEPLEISRLTADPVQGYPTVIRVAWVQNAPATVHAEYSFDPDQWVGSPERELEIGNHEELLLGIPADVDVAWRLISVDGQGQTETWFGPPVHTDPLPPELPVGQVLVNETAKQDQTMRYVLAAVFEGPNVGSRTWTMLIDRRGRVLWAHRSPLGRVTMHPRISWHEDSFLIDHSSYFGSFDGGAASEILSLKIDGTEVKRWATPGHHHPFTDLPDGSLAYAAYQNSYGGRAEDDLIIVIDPAGVPHPLVGCRSLLYDLGEFDWCGSNTVTYDEARNLFLFSIFTHDSIVQLDATTGAVQRWYGHVPTAWAFSPPASAFWYQHGPTFTDQGTLLVSTHAEQNTEELVVREYQVDEANERLVAVWQAGSGVPGRQMGEAHRLPGGNTLHNYGTNAVLREFTPEGEVVWDIRWEPQQYNGTEEHQIGRSAPVLVDLWAFAPDRP